MDSVCYPKFPYQYPGVSNVLKSMEKGSGLSELSAVKGCLLSRVPLYNILSWELCNINHIQFLSTCSVQNGKKRPDPFYCVDDSMSDQPISFAALRQTSKANGDRMLRK